MDACPLLASLPHLNIKQERLLPKVDFHSARTTARVREREDNRVRSTDLNQQLPSDCAQNAPTNARGRLARVVSDTVLPCATK